MPTKSTTTKDQPPPPQHPTTGVKWKVSKCVKAVMEKYFTCPICHDIVTDAHIDPECLHRYCGKCVKDSLHQYNNGCPTCQVHIPTPQTLKRDTTFEAIKDAMQDILEIINEDHAMQSRTDHPTNSVSYESESESLPAFKQEESYFSRDEDSTLPGYYDKNDSEYKFSLGLSLRSTVDKSKTVHVHVPSQQDHCKKATSDHSPSHTVESLLSSSYHQSLRKDTLNDQRSWHVNNDIDSCEEMDGDIHPLPVKREEEENVKQPSQQITPFESHDTQDSDMLSSPLRQNQVSCSAKRSFDTSPSSIVQPPKKRIKKSFNERFEELKEFKKTHGHCNVPRRNNEYKSLGNWCSEIRKTHKGTRNNMTLTPSNKRDLERIGFKWTRQEKKK